MTLELDWLKRWACYAPQAIALQSGETGESWSYDQLYRRSLRAAAYLRDHYGISRGDRVVCVAQNQLDYVSLFFATQRLGAILVPVNFRFKPSEVEHIVSDCAAKVVLDDAGLAQLSAATASGAVEEIAFASSFEDICMVLYTSGTTGFPKGAMLSYRMIFWNSINTGLRLNLTQNDVVVTFLPLFHTGGWNVLTTPCLHRGAKVILLKKFDAEIILRLCDREKVTVLFGVPTTLDLLSRSPSFADVNLDSIRYAIVGGEPMSLELIHLYEQRGIPVRQGYGLTEFGPNVFSLGEEDSRRKAGSIGFPNFYIDARVVDERGRDVGTDKVGELILRGPTTMSGYWGNDRATAEVLRDGWFYTGDLVRKDSEGFFYVSGRKKEMFISGGENVYPAEVERVLRRLPGVREAAVIGVPDMKWGECGKAFVSFEEGRSLSVEDMREFCLQHLAKFKVPAQFVVMKDLPKNESGKIAKKFLD